MYYQKLWHFWKKFGRILGKIQTTIILSIIYYFLVTPIGLFKKLISRKNKPTTYWITLPPQNHDLKKSYEQY